MAEVAILGCGVIGTAVLKGLLQDNNKQGWKTWACVRSKNSLERLRRDLNEQVIHISLGCGNESLKQATESAEIILLGCVPKDLENILTQEVTQTLKGKLVVSMLAGVPSAQIASTVTSKGGSVGSVARIIPSMAAAFGQSVTLLAADIDYTPKHLQLLTQLLNGIGSIVPVPEADMSTATAIGAACHALIIHAVDSLTDAGVADGIQRDVAAKLAAQCLHSASFLVSKEGGGYTPESLKAAMSTPAGITMNSYLKLHQGGVPSGIADASRAAVAYAKCMTD